MTRTPRLLLVDDSAFVRRATQRMLEPLGVRVVGTATTGEEAVEQACTLRPDLIILDVDMPGMDGIEALERIMRRCPAPVLLMSSLARDGAEVTLRALEAGAVDFVDKSGAGGTMDIHALAPLLRAKVAAILDAPTPPNPQLPLTDEATPDEPPPKEAPPGPYDVVAIGASTGGPRALAELVPALPAGLRAAVVIAQHMPSGFTRTLAERLDLRAPISVAEARDGEPLRPGRVRVAPGGMQTTVEHGEGGLFLRVREDGASLHRPSVDRLLTSVAEACGARAVGVVLTGMGSDGADGLRRIREAGGRTLAESRETAVIDGMTAAARPHAEQVLPLPRIAPALTALCGGAR